jgi:phenylalanyl-tRNA synthetase beta chain
VGCPRYACVALRGIKVGPAPEWMQQRLQAVGQRPVNNIVDVTNYVLLEQGQPLHAFDLARVRAGQIVVRRAAAGEKITSIDHTDRTLQADDLVICDGHGPVAIAGVMGGAESEINGDTTDVLIECANFEPSTVRRTARRLGMHTDSSHRFERGVDVTRIGEVLDRTVELLLLTQDDLGVEASLVGGVIDSYPVTFAPPVITMPVDMPTRVLGLEIDAATVLASLTRLGLDVVRDGDNVIARVPAYRPDLSRPIDLVEEVGRLVGYNEIPTTPLTGELGLLPIEREDDAPREQPTQPVLSTGRVDAEELLGDCLASLGYSEAVNWAMIDPERDALFVGDDEPAGLALRNPLGADRSALRRSLIPGLLESLRHNVSRGTRDVRLFELGHVFPGGDIQVENPEPQHIALVATGELDAHWSGAGRSVDGFDVVGAIQQAAAAVGSSIQVVTGDAPSWMHPGEHAVLKLGRRAIGWVGRVHPNVCEQWELEAPVYAADLNVGVLLARDPGVPRYTEIARTPTSQRDLALVVPNGVQFDEMDRALKQFRHKYLESVTLFDVYSGPGLEPGTKSIALRARYRDIEGTLTDKAIEKVHGKLLGHLGRMVGATLRA